MDIGSAFTFIKDDEKWLEKVGIGIGLLIFSFLIVPVMILSGYAIRILQNVRDGQSSPLPAWDDWGGDLARGFKLWVIQFIWAIPLFLFVVPTAIGGAIADTGDAGEFIGGALLICASCLMVLYGLFLALVAPGYTISFAKDERVGSGLQLTTIWHWTQSNLGQVIIVTLVIIAAGFIVTALAGLIGLILCGIGIILTMPLASVILIFFQNHLYGQLAHSHPMYASPGAASPLQPDSPVTPSAAVPGEEIVADETDAGAATDTAMADAPTDEGVLVAAAVAVAVDESPSDEISNIDVTVEETVEVGAEAEELDDTVEAVEAVDVLDVPVMVDDEEATADDTPVDGSEEGGEPVEAVDETPTDDGPEADDSDEQTL